MLNLIVKIQIKFNFVYELKPQWQQLSHFLQDTVQTQAEMWCAVYMLLFQTL